MENPVKVCGDHAGWIIVFPESAISDINAHPLLRLNKMSPCRALGPQATPNPTLPLVSLLAYLSGAA